MISKHQRLIYSVLAMAAVLAVVYFGYRDKDAPVVFMNGELTAPHAQLAAECSRCHTPWQGVSESTCIECHTKRNSRFDDKHFAKADVKPEKCFGCHQEHQGFAHDLTIASDDKCRACHQGKLHKERTRSAETTGGIAKMIAFSHAVHYEEEAIEDDTCDECHGDEKALDKAMFEKPKMFDSSCAACHKLDKHDGAPEGDEACVLCHLEKPQIRPVATEHLDFSHELHGIDECDKCHESLLDLEAEYKGESLATSVCQSCHKRYDATNACAGCHTYHGEKSRPKG